MPITGRDVAEIAGVPIVIGGCNEFNWRTGAITLEPDVANGASVAALLVAAHEAGHALQPKWVHWFRWLLPVYWWEEQDAWTRAVLILDHVTTAVKSNKSSVSD